MLTTYIYTSMTDFYNEMFAFTVWIVNANVGTDLMCVCVCTVNIDMKVDIHFTCWFIYYMCTFVSKPFCAKDFFFCSLIYQSFLWAVCPRYLFVCFFIFSSSSLALMFSLCRSFYWATFDISIKICVYLVDGVYIYWANVALKWTRN